MIAFQSLRQRKPIDWALGLLPTLSTRLNLTLLSVVILFQLSGPLMAMPERSVITLQDTTQLSLRVWAVAAPQRIIVGIHGFNDYSKAFDPLARSLATELSATFYAYDQRGSGENPPQVSGRAQIDWLRICAKWSVDSVKNIPDYRSLLLERAWAAQWQFGPAPSRQDCQ